jgi:glycosyltransferase involved in cell wall biosynthesis
MTLSVALCTCNGAAFLSDQLASLAAQVRPPDELVVCDDASTDDTPAVLEAFAAGSAFPVRVARNPVRLGATPNFERAIRLCTGDVIALCDQDDVWKPHKLRVLELELRANPRAGVVFSNAALVGANGEPLRRTLWGALELTHGRRRRLAAGRGLEVLVRWNVVSGAAMAFRSSLCDLVLPIPPGWVHDAWIALLVAAVAPIVPVAEPLIDYRQHPAQQIGERKRGLVAQYRKAWEMGRGTFEGVAERFAEALARLRNWPGVPPERVRLLEEKVCHAQVRAGMRTPGVWRLPRVAREWWAGGYRRFSRGWKAAAQDLFLP